MRGIGEDLRPNKNMSEKYCENCETRLSVRISTLAVSHIYVMGLYASVFGVAGGVHAGFTWVYVPQKPRKIVALTV